MIFTSRGPKTFPGWIKHNSRTKGHLFFHDVYTHPNNNHIHRIETIWGLTETVVDRDSMCGNIFHDTFHRKILVFYCPKGTVLRASQILTIRIIFIITLTKIGGHMSLNWPPGRSTELITLENRLADTIEPKFERRFKELEQYEIELFGGLDWIGNGLGCKRFIWWKMALVDRWSGRSTWRWVYNTYCSNGSFHNLRCFDSRLVLCF